MLALARADDRVSGGGLGAAGTDDRISARADDGVASVLALARADDRVSGGGLGAAGTDDGVGDPCR